MTSQGEAKEQVLQTHDGPSAAARAWEWLSLLIALVGVAGSLYLSLGMGLKACPLCFYQRTFVMAAASVLAVGMWVGRERAGLAAVIALPLVWGGLGVAAFHEYLVLAGVLECPLAIFGFGTAPAQSLAIFALLTLTCTAGAWSARGAGWRSPVGGILASIILGAVMAWACVASSPPLPPAPGEPYDPARQPLDMCRPVFKEA